MRISRTALAIAALCAGLATTGAMAGERQDAMARDKVIRDFCKGSDARDCKDYRANRKTWTESQYRAFYARNLAGKADAEVARLFGVKENG